MVRRKSWNI